MRTKAGVATSEARRGERLQKILSRMGLGSRREIETWITAGRITVNNNPAVLGSRAVPSDLIKLDGRPLKAVRRTVEALTVIAVNKPVDVVCTRRDPEGRRTVFSLLPRVKHGRWISVGRLDVNTSGLLLFTNDGELAHRLTHPRYRIDREYVVRVFGAVDDQALKRMREGIEIDGASFAFDDIVRAEGHGANQWFYCVVQRGRNREVRRLWESQGVSVSRLTRVRFGNIVLPKALKAGRHFKVEDDLLADLCKLVDLDPAKRSAA